MNPIKRLSKMRGEVGNFDDLLFCQCYIQTADKVIEDLETELKLATHSKNEAYTERNMLVAALSKIFPASLERAEDGRAPEWIWVVIIDTPNGQASWNIPTSEIRFFDHLPREIGRKWDGHTTPEKYGRLFGMKKNW